MMVSSLDAENAHALASAFGTPLIVIDLRILDATISAFKTACEPHDAKISYAGKALLTTALARHIDAQGLGIDVCSLGELVTAERAAVAPSRLTMHGAGKLDDELQAALDGRVGRLVIDSLDEVRRLRAMASARTLDVLLRINTGIVAHTHDLVRTAGDDSKFGIAPHEEAEALATLRGLNHLRLRGVHAHIGSQIYEPAAFAANAEALAAAVARIRDAGFTVDTMVCGGGFGVPVYEDAPHERLDVRAAIEEMASYARAARATLEIEPGRALIAQAGTTLYRVLARKRFDRRTFLIVDGSLGDNPRPAMYDAVHRITEVEPPGDDTLDVTVCGRSCENDELGTARVSAGIAAGALLAVQSTGAYTYSMASNYNRFARPALVAIGLGAPFLLARRETIDDVLKNDV